MRKICKSLTMLKKRTQQKNKYLSPIWKVTDLSDFEKHVSRMRNGARYIPPFHSLVNTEAFPVNAPRGSPFPISKILTC